MLDSPTAILKQSRRARPCPLCGGEARHFASSRDHFYAASPERFHVLLCERCIVGFLDPPPSREVLARFYPDEYYVLEDSRLTSRARARDAMQRLTLSRHYGYPPSLEPAFAARRPGASAVLARWWRRRETRMPRFVAGGTVLDVGCSTGGFMARARGLGWEVLGVEPSGPAVRMARAQDLRVLEGELEEATLAPASVDAVRLSGVLEHVPEPWRVLAEVNRVLRPGGEVVVNLQNVSSWNARLLKGFWHHLDAPRHLTHFNPASLTRALLEAGFVDPRVAFCSGYSGSWHSLLAMANALAYGRGQQASLLETPVARSRWTRAIKYALIPPLSLWALLTDRSGRGELFTIRAVKGPPPAEKPPGAGAHRVGTEASP